ncbi:hypothetical protein BH23BAC1_BH23BAC1_44630 [soil metagenome]
MRACADKNKRCRGNGACRPRRAKAAKGEKAVRLGDVAAFENRQPVTAAKFINKSSLFILLLGAIRRLELKPNSEQKVENIYSSPRHIAKPPVIASSF